MTSPVIPILIFGAVFIALLLMPDAKDTVKSFPSKLAMIFVTLITVAIKAYVTHCFVVGGGTCDMYAWLNTALVCTWMITASALLLHKKLILDE